MDLNKENYKKILKLIVTVILIYLCVKNIYVIWKAVISVIHFISPLLLGMIFAFIINVPLRSIEGRLRYHAKKKKWKIKNFRLISVLLTVLLVAGIIAVILFLVIPELSSTIKMLLENAPMYGAKIESFLNSIGQKFPPLSGFVNSVVNLEIDWEAIKEWISTIQSGEVGSVVVSTVDIISNVVGAVVNFVIAIVFAFYILFQKEQLSEQVKRLLYAALPQKYVVNVLNFCKLVDDTYSSFLIGQCTEATILGSLFIVAMLILRMPYAFLVGPLVTVTALIPIVGSTIACVVGALLMLTVSPLKMIIFIAMFLALQQIESHFIYPNVVGSSMGLPPIWVLMAVIFGAKLFGIGGLLIGIPTVSVLYVLLDQWMCSKLEKKEVPDEEWKNVNRSEADRRKEEKIRERKQKVIKMPEKFPAKLKEIMERDDNSGQNEKKEE